MGRFPAWAAAMVVFELCSSLVMLPTGVYGQKTLLQSLFFKDTQARLNQPRPMIRGLRESSIEASTRTLTSVTSSSTIDEASHSSSGASSTATTTSVGKLNSNSTSTSAGSFSNRGNTTTAITTTSSNQTKTNSKTTTTTKVTDPGEHQTTFKRPLPPSYIYKDDDNAPSIVFNSPLNPVVDDISQFLDDNYNATRNVLPPEKDPPSSWPLDVFGIFVGAAIVLFAATAYKNYKKRKAYTPVPSS